MRAIRAAALFNDGFDKPDLIEAKALLGQVPPNMGTDSR